MDGRGAMGFPMRLTLAFILIALCIPSLSEMVTGFEEQSDERLAEEQVGNIVSAASDVFYGGVGSGTSLTVSVPAGYSIEIGGEDQDGYSLRVVNGDTTVLTHYTEHPALMFLNETAISGVCEITITCTVIDGVYGIEVSA